MDKFYRLHLKVDEFFGGLFEKLGRFIARHPWKVIIFVSIVDIAFGFGLLKLERDNSTEQYTPKDSTASKHRTLLYQMFDIDTSRNFYQQSLVDFGQYATVIIQKKDGGNILDNSTWHEITSIKEYVVATSATSGGVTYTYTDVCAKRFSACVIDGEYILGADFKSDLNNGTVSFPSYNTSGVQYNIQNNFGNVKSSLGFLISASAVKLTFHLDDSDNANNWQDAFLTRIKIYTSSTLKLEFAHADSVDDELYANITSDITFFAVTFMLMITFAGLVLYGGNNVSNRYGLGMAGIVSTGLAIIGSFGFVCLCGVLFASIVGTMPFLIIGIGVDDMFILLSGLADTSHIDDVETRIGKTMRTSGIAVTITSLTDVIAFCAGASSIFPAVKHFSLFTDTTFNMRRKLTTSTAILFCYLNYITFFLGCMTINEYRISQNRHFFTCRITKSKEEMKEAKNSKIAIFCCAGSPHKHRDEIEGPIEKYPKKAIKKIVLFTPAKFIILLLFASFVAISIYGTVNFKEGFDLKDIVASNSYYYSYQEDYKTLYSQSLTISLNVQSGVDYRSNDTLTSINMLRDNLQNNQYIDDKFFLSWLHAYMSSGYFDNSSDVNFIASLKTYLATVEGNLYINDVMIDGSTIYASRFHVLTENIISSTAQGKMMLRVREIVEMSSLPVFPYSVPFLFIEQFVAISSQTLQTIGICVGVVFFITTVFLPLPVMILFITMTVVLIMVSVIGFMHFWGLTLSSITMIHIIMCIGFCVDFSTHICHAFAQAEGSSRNDRVSEALDRAGGPILNGALSTIVGVLMLAFSKSFIFFSFFKVMFMVMCFGMMYALFLLPVLLSFFGPNYEQAKKKTERCIKNVELNKNTKNKEDSEITSTNEDKSEQNGSPLLFTNQTFTQSSETISFNNMHKDKLPPITSVDNQHKKKKKKKKRKKRKEKNMDIEIEGDIDDPAAEQNTISQ